MQSNNTEIFKKKRKRRQTKTVKRAKHKKTRFTQASFILLLTASDGMKRLLMYLRTMLVKDNKGHKERRRSYGPQ